MISGSLEFLCILYILFVLKEIEQQTNIYDNNESISLFKTIRRRFTENFEVYFNLRRNKYSQRFLTLTLASLFIEFICFSGNFVYLRK